MKAVKQCMLMILTTAAWLRTPSVADQAVLDYPIHLPGASLVQKYPASNATRVLVHIRQTHYVDMTLEEDGRVRPVQQDIYRIMSRLTEEKYHPSVFCEGETTQLELLAGYLNYFKGIALRKSAKDPLKLASTSTPEAEKTYYAPLELLKERKVTLLPGEDSDAYEFHGKIEDQYRQALEDTVNSKEETSDELKVQMLRQKSDAAMERREDALLSIIEKTHTVVAYTIYGGMHDWRNNVENWNHEHPTDKYALIVITPTSYK